MAKKSDWESFLEYLVVGGVGYIAGKPNPTEQQIIALFRRRPELFQQFNGFLASEKKIKDRLTQLGSIPDKNKLRVHRTIYRTYKDAIRLYILGFNRWAIISSAAIIEQILKGKFSKSSFVELIEIARAENLITQSDRHFLDGIRTIRNEFVHELDNEPTDHDAILTITIMFKIVRKIYFV